MDRSLRRSLVHRRRARPLSSAHGMASRTACLASSSHRGFIFSGSKARARSSLPVDSFIKCDRAASSAPLPAPRANRVTMSSPRSAPVPTIRVKVKFNGVYHEIYINSQASFGELKKMMSAKMGLHPEDQKLVYKDKERDSKAFLDMAGVRDRSKMVLLEDPAAQAKRLLEQRRIDKAERAAKSMNELTEALMNELVKQDSIAADGEVKVQRRMQQGQRQRRREHERERARQGPRASPPAAPPPPTQSWETFDLLSSVPSTSLVGMTTTMAAVTTTSPAAATASPIPQFDWELF
ncbi:BAG family molecular chaperone regulator 1-like [Panicum miliaceum]|uniref:BAG family molecular chaperone regulator 1-like n=1 Tax=Panicum miliaceum TaxID=4540 RepID=A0A3L6SUU9_PANMI|nr:BAG family molecular chaperone regulator 1-like [Panicum miliaceum]